MIQTIKRITKKNQHMILSRIEHQKNDLSYIKGQKRILFNPIFEGHIENFIGIAQMPIGLMGPIKVNGDYAQGEYFVPLATTEGTLVASYNRGAAVITASGGAKVVCLSDQIYRTPGFVFQNLTQAHMFGEWCQACLESIRSVAYSTSGHIDLKSMRVIIEGNYVFLELSYYTGDAAGQNMVTVATQAVVEFIKELSPVPFKKAYVESNMSGDKKATYLAHINGRGKRLVAEILISRDIVRQLLHVSPEDIVEYYQLTQVAAQRAGAMGTQAHYANGLAAMFIACGQDVACVAESANGNTRASIAEDGQLYVSVSLPNMVVGTVGGGTYLPTQRECLEIMGCFGDNSARKFAEICACVCLAGEISIAAAIAGGHFASAHRKHGRAKLKQIQPIKPNIERKIQHHDELAHNLFLL